MGNCYHAVLAQGTAGRVIGAGHMRIVKGQVEVFGESVGYEIQATEKDREILQNYLIN